MRRSLLLVTLAAAVLAAPPIASAAYVPRFLVTHDDNTTGTQSGTTLRLTLPRDHDATARIQILVPLAYQLTTTAAAGTVVGSSNAQVLATAISPDTVAPLEGPVRAQDPAQFVNNQCAPGAHSAVWVAELAFSGQTIPVPFYVDAVPAANQQALQASHTITVCFSSPYIPPAAGGAPLGAKILTANLTFVESVTTTPSSAALNVWRGIFTPYVVGTATANAPGTVEARSMSALPKRITLTVRVTRRVIRLTGRLTEGPVGVAGRTVVISRARSPRRQPFRMGILARKTTGANGQFAHTLRVRRAGFHRFQVRAVVPERDLGAAGCAGPSPAPGGCVSATAGGFTVQGAVSRLTRVR